MLLALLLAVTTLIAGPPASRGDEPATAREPSTSEPFVADSPLYVAGDYGYACFRIPAVVRATNGDLLAFAEGRVADCGDDGDIDLVLRRSTDGGQTWSDLQVVSEGNGETHGNPVPVVDRESGRIALISTHNGPEPCRSGCLRTPYLQLSEDNGVTWTEPRLLADATRPHWDHWYATGPMHGIQLQRGEHAGRLVVGASFEYVAEDSTHVYGTHLLLSDDGGLSWRIGAQTSRDDGRVIAQEVTVAELTNGDVYALARERGTDPGSRAFATSSDGGETWDRRFMAMRDLAMPDVQGSLLRFSATDQGGEDNRLLLSAPLHPTSREVMGVRTSTDEGKSFNEWPEAKVFWWGPAAYSDLVRLDGDRAALMYEAGSWDPYESIRFARFNEAFLDSPNENPPNVPGPADPGPTTPDLSVNDNAAFVRGGAQLTDGRFGPAVEVDGSDDRVEVPFNSSLDLGDGDFTITLWFRYGTSEERQSLFWAYRLGCCTTPQLWLRAEPGSNRIRAMLAADRFTTSVQTSSAYDDNAWHFLVLQRRSGKLILTVDGDEQVQADVPDGSVTAGQQFGLHGFHLGERIDGANRLEGGLDEFRVYRRALGESELTAIHTGNADIGGRLDLRLPLDRIDPVPD